MNPSKHWLQRFTISVLFAHSFLVFAADINQIDTIAQEQTRQQERMKQLRQQQEVQPDIRDAIDQFKNIALITTDLIPDHETPCFTITKIELIGDSAHQFQFALDEVLENYRPA